MRRHWLIDVHAHICTYMHVYACGQHAARMRPSEYVPEITTQEQPIIKENFSLAAETHTESAAN